MSIWPIPQFSTFTPDECRAMLATERVGRLVVAGSRRSARPVHYHLDADALVLGDAAADGGGLRALAGRTGRLEVEHYDMTVRAGWNVVARGVLEPDAGDAAPAARLRLRELRGQLVLSEPLYPSFRLDDPAFV